MENTITTYGKWSLITSSGRVDGHTSSELDSALKSALSSGAKFIALDLSGVDYMSSAGLRVLLATYKSVKALALHNGHSTSPRRKCLW